MIAKWWLLLFGWLVAPVLARGHVGSPDVFFSGCAGSYEVRVAIRPSATLPGLAQIDVRLAESDRARVWVRAGYWEAGTDGAPAATEAQPATNDPQLFNTSVWLLRRGSYRVEVEVDGARGRGVAIVPLNSAATQPPAMPASLVAGLLASGAVLCAAAIWLAAATAREGTLEAGAGPRLHARARGRRAGLAMSVILAGALGAGAARWRAMDGKFRRDALDQPRPVEARIRTAGTLQLLTLAAPAAEPAWDALAADHGKLMHLFLCREPDFTAFAHLHPVRRDARTFENVLPPLPAGAYQLYAEITRDNGASQTLTSRLMVPAPIGPALPPTADATMVNEVWCRAPTAPLGNSGQPFALDADDSWLVAPEPAAPSASRTQVSALSNGSSVVFQNAGDLVENRETALQFSLFTAEGRRAAIQPYMGMSGHAVVRRADGTVFTHLHPAGTISMAAQEIFSRADGTVGKMSADNSGGEVSFPYAFPRAGKYRVWVQIRTEGRISTAVFDVLVRPASIRG